jgi:hypothetical protein
MALGALFSVFVFVKAADLKLPALKNLKSSALSFIDRDWDDDGLDNDEESYWNTDPNSPDTDGDNFLDGEEVASGHDPLIPGPDDFLPTTDNLTHKMSALTLSGLYEGSLKPDSPQYEEELNALALVVMDDAMNSFEIDPSKIKITVISSNKKSQQAYIEEFSRVYEELLTTFAIQMRDLESNIENIGLYGFADESVSKSFRGSAAGYKKALNELSRMSVPQNWHSNHLGVIKLAGSLANSNEAIANGETDPIKGAVALNQIVNLWEVLPKITETYSKKIADERLDTLKTIFK